MSKIFILGLLSLLLLTACGGTAPSREAEDAQGESVITVFKSPT